MKHLKLLAYQEKLRTFFRIFHSLAPTEQKQIRAQLIKDLLLLNLEYSKTS